MMISLQVYKAITSESLSRQERLLNATHLFPTLANYRDAVSSISLLQETYRLNITSLAAGEIRSKDFAFESSYAPHWKEFNSFATAADQRGWADTGITWMEAAIGMGQRDMPDDVWEQLQKDLEVT